MSKHHLSQAGNKMTGAINITGLGILGNNFNVGGNFVLDTGYTLEAREKECLAALFVTNPADDRARLVSFKGRVVTSTCDWIINHYRYKLWKNVRTRSQLLWVSGMPGMGKTMLWMFLTQELEKMLEPSDNTVVLYYFCNGRDAKRNNAVSVLRGLIFLLLRAHPDLIKLLLPEYEIQRESLFSQTALEALWRIFESMIRDASTGQVYCTIDGLDECIHASLWHLLKKIRNFYLEVVVDEGEQDYIAHGESKQPDRTGQKLGTGLKMILVSGEEPECLLEDLADFPRVRIGVETS